MALRATRALLTAVPPHPTKATATNLRPRIRKTVLEVERKFHRLTVPTLNNLHLHHHHNSGNSSSSSSTPKFKSVLPLPTHTIHDIYYDTPHHTLCSSGVWIRRRNGAWEAKVNNRRAWGGDFVNSRFEEVCGEEEVGRCVEAVLGARHGCRTGDMGADMFGLGKLAEFVTTREAWLVDGEFKVVRDRMDFGHEVGEVELQVEVDGGRGVGEEEKGVLMDEMDRRIEGFMRRYAWAWERGEAVGKLTAYFGMVKRG